MSQVQITIAKPAKNAPKAVTKANKDHALAAIKYTLQAGTARPQRGAALFAHTVGFFQASGMLINIPAPLAMARTILGDTAINYHVRKGNLAKTEAGLTLTDDGMNFFAIRPADVDAVNAYAEFFTTGKTEGLPLPVKSESFVTRVA